MFHVIATNIIRLWCLSILLIVSILTLHLVTVGKMYLPDNKQTDCVYILYTFQSGKGFKIIEL